MEILRIVILEPIINNADIITWMINSKHGVPFPEESLYFNTLWNLLAQPPNDLEDSDNENENEDEDHIPYENMKSVLFNKWSKIGLLELDEEEVQNVQLSPNEEWP